MQYNALVAICMDVMYTSNSEYSVILQGGVNMRRTTPSDSIAQLHKQKNAQKTSTCLVLAFWFGAMIVTDRLFGYPIMQRVDSFLAILYFLCTPLAAMHFMENRRSFLGMLAIANLLAITSIPLFLNWLDVPIEIILLRHVVSLLFAILIGPSFIQPHGLAFFGVIFYNALCFYIPILRGGRLDMMLAYIVVTYSFTLLFSYFFLDIMRSNVTRISSLLSAREEAEDLALRDELTGVFNRRYCDNLLRILVENDVEKVLLFVELEDYQKINQAHGHLVGEAYLKKAAEAIKEFVRPDDILTRFGGQQFVMILETADIQMGQSISRRVREGLSKIMPEYPNVSIGITKIVPGITEQAVLVNADTALYRAQNASAGGHIAVVDPANPRVEAAHWETEPGSQPR